MTIRKAGNISAEAYISGEISTYADWNEDIYFFDPDGAAMSLTGIAFYMQFRSDPEQESADVTLSTAAGTLSLVADSGAVTSILRIDADDALFSSYIGDMVVDLLGVDGSDVKTHYGHGVVTFTNSPVAI